MDPLEDPLVRTPAEIFAYAKDWSVDILHILDYHSGEATEKKLKELITREALNVGDLDTLRSIHPPSHSVATDFAHRISPVLRPKDRTAPENLSRMRTGLEEVRDTRNVLDSVGHDIGGGAEALEVRQHRLELMAYDIALDRLRSENGE